MSYFVTVLGIFLYSIFVQWLGRLIADFIIDQKYPKVRIAFSLFCSFGMFLLPFTKWS